MDLFLKRFVRRRAGGGVRLRIVAWLLLRRWCARGTMRRDIELGQIIEIIWFMMRGTPFVQTAFIRVVIGELALGDIRLVCFLSFYCRRGMFVVLVLYRSFCVLWFLLVSRK